jgi:arogenate/prephenate dehydratase
MTTVENAQPEAIPRGVVVVGIQGGLGSFNHMAADEWVPKCGLARYELRCFDSTTALFQGLRAGQVDLGQFAIFNSSAGFYSESLQAVSQNIFEVVANYKIPIVHYLIHHPDIRRDQVIRIITHKEVLKQCTKKLGFKYPSVEITVGSGDLTEPASVAAAIAAGKLERNVATISCMRLAEEHGLMVGDSGLQDIEGNESTFLLVR